MPWLPWSRRVSWPWGGPRSRDPRAESGAGVMGAPEIRLLLRPSLADMFRMEREETSQLPSWLREGLDAEATDTKMNKRTESRHVWMVPVHARFPSDPAHKPISAKPTFVEPTCNCRMV